MEGGGVHGRGGKRDRIPIVLKGTIMHCGVLGWTSTDENTDKLHTYPLFDSAYVQLPCG